MSHSAQIARHFRELHFGGNTTGVNFKNVLRAVSWEQAARRIHFMHPVSTLVFHVNYYVAAVLQVLKGGPLDAHDKFSFDAPAIESANDWERLLAKFWKDADAFAAMVEQMPESALLNNMADPKYGNWYRNLHGIIEHSHYHLGQIALIKKLVTHSEAGTQD